MEDLELNNMQPNQVQDLSGGLDFDYPLTRHGHSIIKVVGVGGGGSNAVRHMYESGIKDVSFLIINTDKQALDGSPIPNRLQISDKGLGAGAKPEIARAFALEYKDQIRQALNDGTEMVFITAGMGGGTGTGASPVVAEVAHEMGILTIGIVTIPFSFEGKRKISMALHGVDEISKYVDALLVVNNNRLINIYPDLTFFNAFSKADDTLTIAAKSISDIITKQGYINLDFADVKTTLKDGGVALISTGQASGEGRLTKAIRAAKESPLLQDNEITDAKHLLFEICFSESNPITMAEIDEMNTFVESLNSEIEVIWGAMVEDNLGDEVRIILLASGFAIDHGAIIPVNQDDAERRKKLQEIREAKDKLQGQIEIARGKLLELDPYPEAHKLLFDAVQKAEHAVITEVAQVEELIQTLFDVRGEAKALADRLKQEQEIEKRRQELLQQLAALNQPKTPQVETPAPAAPKPEPVEDEFAIAQRNFEERKRKEAEEAAAKLAGQKAAEEAQKAAEAQKAQEEAKKAAQAEVERIAKEKAEAELAAVEAAKPAPSVHPATSTNDAIEQMRRYYGEEAARKFMMDEVRKAYCILDDEELTNEQLIERLEQLPAYNRNVSDLGHLRAVNVAPATPKVIGDGSIHF